MNGEFVTSEGYRDLDGVNVKAPEIRLVSSELAHRLIGRDFSEISVSATAEEVVWITVRFPAVIEDVETLRDIAAEVEREKVAS